MLGSIQVSGQHLTSVDIKDISTSLKANEVRLLSLRQCRVGQRDFATLTRYIGPCKSVFHLNFNLGLLSSLEKVVHLAEAININRSLTAIFLHGTPLGYKGLRVLAQALCGHPKIVTLDLGDCQLTDQTIPIISLLLPTNGAKPGLQDLTLSGNPLITPSGWNKLFMAMAAECSLQTLHLDYNVLGDFGLGCLVVALAANDTITTLDLERTDITDHGAQQLLHLVKTYPVALENVHLKGNRIRKDTIKAINRCLADESDNENSSTETSSGTLDSDVSTTTGSTDSGRSTLESSSSSSTSQTETQNSGNSDADSENSEGVKLVYERPVNRAGADAGVPMRKTRFAEQIVVSDTYTADDAMYIPGATGRPPGDSSSGQMNTYPVKGVSGMVDTGSERNTHRHPALSEGMVTNSRVLGGFVTTGSPELSTQSVLANSNRPPVFPNTNNNRPSGTVRGFRQPLMDDTRFTKSRKEGSRINNPSSWLGSGFENNETYTTRRSLQSEGNKQNVTHDNRPKTAPGNFTMSSDAFQPDYLKESHTDIKNYHDATRVNEKTGALNSSRSWLSKSKRSHSVTSQGCSPPIGYSMEPDTDIVTTSRKLDSH